MAAGRKGFQSSASSNLPAMAERAGDERLLARDLGQVLGQGRHRLEGRRGECSGDGGGGESHRGGIEQKVAPAQAAGLVVLDELPNGFTDAPLLLDLHLFSDDGELPAAALHTLSGDETGVLPLSLPETAGQVQETRNPGPEMRGCGKKSSRRCGKRKAGRPEVPGPEGLIWVSWVQSKADPGSLSSGLFAVADAHWPINVGAMLELDTRCHCRTVQTDLLVRPDDRS